MIEDGSVAEMLERPQDYIDSRDYFSWERYFTRQLVQRTQDNYLKYTKSSLNPVYLQDKVADRILAVMKGINLN